MRGILSLDDTLYPLGTDTKVLSTIFELIVRPQIAAVAAQNALLLREPQEQNYYPDFTLMRDEQDDQKVAVDVKSTYRNWRRDGSWTAGFTLGSYTSFIRNNTKNIVFPFDQYAKHIIIGFVYSRAETLSLLSSNIRKRGSVLSPFSDVEWFVQEKYRIASDKPGSGNTANIGSIRAKSVTELSEGNGPFSTYGESVFLEYWRNYGTSSTDRAYTNIEEYLKWREP